MNPTLARAGVPVLLSLAVLGLPFASSSAQDVSVAAPKPASAATIEANRAALAQLPMQDARDLEESRRGFIAAPADKRIRDANGRVIWDMSRYDFIEPGSDSPDTVNPSLWRQAQANMGFGLYEVLKDRIYQVRGFDLANMTLIKGDTGWIIFDVLTTKETAAAALALANATLGPRPVVAVVYSHSHADHFGGVRGVIDEADVRAGKVQIIAPDGFMEHAVSENVLAGPAMQRRLHYQYGTDLPVSARGHVDQAIGKTISTGTVTLLAPTRLIKGEGESLTLDGVQMVFQSTPGTEAPAEMNTWFPQWRAFWGAENLTATIHNIYTLRGALVRDALVWSKAINESLYRFGPQAEVMFTAHTWPRWGNARIQEIMRAQRDAYAHLNNWTLHEANLGVTINEIQNVYEPPDSLRRQWAAHSYHGSEAHNSRAVINRVLGYWDANPATLEPLSPRDSAPLYVSMMGGATKIMAKARELDGRGDYRLAMEILNKLVYAEPGNRAARELLADTFEQLGYQKESTSLRNSYLAAAQELRGGIAPITATSIGPDVLRAMTTGNLLDLLAIRLDADKAAGMALTINLVEPDTQAKYVIELNNSALTWLGGYQSPAPDLTLTLPHSLLLPLLAGRVQLADLIGQGKASAEGDTAVLGKLKALMTDFKPDFEIMPGTRRELLPKSPMAS